MRRHDHRRAARSADAFDLTGRLLCSMDGGGSSPDPNIGMAALRNSEIAGEALDWYRDYTERVMAPLQREQAGLNRQVTQQQMAIAGDAAALARDDARYQRETFRPMERRLAQEADGFNTDAYRERQANLAGADVQSAFAAAQQQQRMEQARRGVSSTAGVSQALDQDMALKRAAAMAGAANAARDNATQLGWARRMDAASLGRGLASSQATNSQVALQAGNSASGVTGNSLAGAAGIASTMGQGFNSAIGANQSAGNLWATSSGLAQQGSMADASARNGMIGSGAALATAVAM